MPQRFAAERTSKKLCSLNANFSVQNEKLVRVAEIRDIEADDRRLQTARRRSPRAERRRSCRRARRDRKAARDAPV